MAELSHMNSNLVTDSALRISITVPFQLLLGLKKEIESFLFGRRLEKKALSQAIVSKVMVLSTLKI